MHKHFIVWVFSIDACPRIEVANAFYRLTDWLTHGAQGITFIFWIFSSRLTIEMEMEKEYLIELEAEQSENTIHFINIKHMNSLDLVGNKS